MLEHHVLEGNETNVMICQMYDYIHLGFAMDSPYSMSFYVNLTEKDVDLIIKKLREAKNSLHSSQRGKKE